VEAQPLGDPARLTQGRKRGILATALGRRLTVGPEILDLVVQVRILEPQPSFVRGASLLVKWGCFFLLARRQAARRRVGRARAGERFSSPCRSGMIEAEQMTTRQKGMTRESGCRGHLGRRDGNAHALPAGESPPSGGGPSHAGARDPSRPSG